MTEKKAAIAWDSVVQKLSESHSSSLPSGVIECLPPVYIHWVSFRNLMYKGVISKGGGRTNRIVFLRKHQCLGACSP